MCVLRMDADLLECPPDVIEQLLATRKDIVEPHYVLELRGPPFDKDAWVDPRHRMDSLRDRELDGPRYRPRILVVVTIAARIVHRCAAIWQGALSAPIRSNGAMDPPINLLEYEALAMRDLPPMARDYYAAGALDEITLRANRRAFARLTLRPRVLTGASLPDLSTEVIGRRHPSPVLIAPTAFARLAHADGELGVARAAAAAGVTQTLSTLSTTPLEDVAAATTEPKWFQLYIFRDRDLTADLVRRAEAAGYEALVLTVDAPVLGRRERDARNRFALPAGLTAANIAAHLPPIEADADDSGLARFFAAQIDPALTWRELETLAATTRLPVLVKGILRGDDARRALDHGAAGVIVSNHGGRQLDTAVATVDALPEVVAAVGGRAPVLIDGGIRRGTDVLKALALGAGAVLIGRPVLWGLAVGGEAGVAHVLALLLAEFEHAMLLSGAAGLADLTPDLVR